MDQSESMDDRREQQPVSANGTNTTTNELPQAKKKRYHRHTEHQIQQMEA